MDDLFVHIVKMNLKNNLKILVVYSSPKKDGYTKKLLDAFLEECPKTAQINFVSAFELGAKPCTDCGYCHKENACKFKDLDEFYKEFELADLIVFATPVYNFSYPAPLKAIFDRFQRYYNARFTRNEKPPISKKRYAVIISTCGSGDEYGFEVIKHQSKSAFSVLNVELCGFIGAKNTDYEKISKDDILKTKLLANSIFNN